MLAELTAAITSVAAIKDLAKTLKDGASDAKWRDHVTALVDNVIDLQSRMLAVQAEYQHIAEVNQAIKKQIEAHEQWSTEADRYQLHEADPGIFVYLIKKERQADDPLHCLCPNCFQQKQKSILIRPHKDTSGYKCHNCSFHVYPTFTLQEMAARSNRSN